MRKIAKGEDVKINLHLAEIIIDLVASYSEIDRDILLSKSRKRVLVDTRHILRCILLDQTKLSKTLIGVITNCHHATVIASKNKFDDLYKTNKEFRNYANNILEFLKTNNIVPETKAALKLINKKYNLLMNISGKTERQIGLIIKNVKKIDDKFRIDSYRNTTA